MHIDQYHYNHAHSAVYAAVTPASDVTWLLYRVVLDTSWIFTHRQLYTVSSAIGKKDDVTKISPRGDLLHQVVQEAEVEQDNGDGAGSCTNGFISNKSRTQICS